MTLLRAFDLVAHRHPDAPALLSTDAQLSYAQLQARSSAVAAALLRQGVGPGDLVALCLPRSLEAVVGILGILRAGAAYVPIDPAYPEERQRWMAENAQVRAALCADATSTPWLPAEARVPLDALPDHADGVLAPHTAPDALLNVLYTSGSTGRPKGVCGTHGAMLNRLRWGAERFPFTAGEVQAHRSSLSFVDAGPELFTALLQGYPTAVITPEEVADLSRFVGALRALRVSRLTVVPSLLSALLRGVPELGTALPLLRTWTTSGEELRLPLLQRFREAAPEATLINLYGTTEVTGDATCAVFAPGEPLPAERVPIGHCIAGAELWVLDAQREVVPDGASGELYIGGPVLARGYHRSPLEESHRFCTHPTRPADRVFRTGDLVQPLPSGGLVFLGRADNLVKLRGIRVELEEIERSLRGACPSVHDVAALVLDGERLVAAATPLTAPLAALHDAAARLLPAPMRPYRFVPLEALPLLPNGKVDRRRLAALLAEGRRELSPERLPATPRERAVAALWRGVLGAVEVARDDSFAALGGTSLGVAELMLAYARLDGCATISLGLARDGSLAAVARALDGEAVPEQAALSAAGLTLTALSADGACDEDVVALLVAASQDPAINASTELPSRLDAERARAYALTNEGVVIRSDGKPIGAGILQRHPNVGEGVTVPPGAVQLDEWLLPEARGRGLLSEGGAWPLLRDWLAQRCDYEVSVVWEDHLAMLGILAARGYTRVGRSYWQSPPGADVAQGYCEVWLADLRPHRRAPPCA